MRSDKFIQMMEEYIKHNSLSYSELIKRLNKTTIAGYEFAIIPLLNDDDQIRNVNYCFTKGDEMVFINNTLGNPPLRELPFTEELLMDVLN